MNKLTWTISTAPFLVACLFLWIQPTEEAYKIGFDLGILILLLNMASLLFLLFAKFKAGLKGYTDKAWAKFILLGLQYPLGIFVFLRLGLQSQ